MRHVHPSWSFFGGNQCGSIREWAWGARLGTPMGAEEIELIKKG